MKRIVFRADGNTSIGLGHIVRSLALVEMLQSDFRCVFITKQPSEKIVQLIRSYCELVELDAVATVAEEVSALKKIVNKQDILVLDFQEHNEAYQLQLKQLVCALVAIDDMAAVHFHTDLIINHGAGDRDQFYNKESNAKLLSGFPYLLMRKTFRDAARTTRTVDKISTLFICFGGSDPFNGTIMALDAGLQCDNIENIIVVTGSAYTNIAELKRRMSNASKNIKHVHDIDSAEMVKMIAQCEIAICPASSISLEVCSVRCGLLTGTVIDNQYGMNNQLEKAGCARSVGSFNAISVHELLLYIKQFTPTLVNEMIANQVKMIDGLSGERLLREFKSLPAC